MSLTFALAPSNSGSLLPLATYHRDALWPNTWNDIFICYLAQSHTDHTLQAH